MEREAARVKFQDADRLFQTKQFEAALRILAELEREFPNERHVLYPTARCLAGLRRYDEARAIAERLVREFNYAPAQELLDRIDRLQAFDNPDVETPALPSGLNELFDTPAVFVKNSPPPRPVQFAGFDEAVEAPSSFRSARPPAARASGSSWPAYALWIGLVVGGFIALVAFTLTVGRPLIDYITDYVQNAEQYEQDPDSVPMPPLGNYAMVWIANYVYSWIIGSLCGYAALRVIDALRFGDFAEDMKDVALYTCFCFLLSLIPILGWIGILILLKKHYELTAGKLIGVVLLYLVFSTITGVVYVIAYYGIVIATVV